MKHLNWPLKKDINKNNFVPSLRKQKKNGRNKFLINQDSKVSEVDNHLQYYWKI